MTVRAAPSSTRISTASSGGYELVELGWDEMTENADRPRRMAGARRGCAEARASRHPPRLRARRPGQGPRSPCSPAPAPSRRGSQRMKAYPRPRRALRLGRCRRACPCRAMPRDPLLRAPGEADRRDRAPDDLAAAPGRARRCGAASPTATIAKLAETVHAFVAMDKGLRALGLQRALHLRRGSGGRASSSSRISAPSPSSTATARSRSATRRRRGSSRSSTARPCRRSCPSPRASSTRSRPTISKRS